MTNKWKQKLISPLKVEVDDGRVDVASDRVDIVQERVSTHTGPNSANNLVDKQKTDFDRKPVSPDYQDEEVEDEEERETVAPPAKHNNVRPEADETPLIVYPSGTVPQNFGANEEQTEEQEEGVEEGEEVPPQYGPQDGVPPQLVPRPPQQGRYPLPPPPGRAPLLQRRPPPPANWRRPPPPPPAGQQYPEGAFPRNVPEEELPQEPAAPRQSPFEGPPRPRPAPANNGGILGGIGSTLSNLAGNIKCGAEDLAADARLQDEAFMQKQLDCVLDKGPCDELGANVKRKFGGGMDRWREN